MKKPPRDSEGESVGIRHIRLYYAGEVPLENVKGCLIDVSNTSRAYELETGYQVASLS